MQSMSIHIGAQRGEIADTVLLPGDPKRARFIAESMLDDATCYNEVRGMSGFTGTFEGRKISVQGTGMGIPSISIYVNELITEYQAKTLIRVGTCGSIQPDLELRDVVLAVSASTDSSINTLRFGGRDYAPTASFSLLDRAHRAALRRGVQVKVGGVFTTDTFYHDDPDYWKLWAEHGILALEMETAALYTLAARHGVDALTILTVTDDLVADKAASAEERQTAVLDMVGIALECSA
jgi:purine-nucleoside phosphorylase